MRAFLMALLSIILYMLLAIAGVIAGLVLGGDRLGLPLGIFLAFLFCAIVAWITHARARKKAARRVPARYVVSRGAGPAARGTVGAVFFQGQVYTSVDDMPVEVRRVYEQMMALLGGDLNRNGIPDILEGIVPTAAPRRTAQDREMRLQELQKMLDGGLITAEDYEAAKAQLLPRK